jgi:hypothetical protein
MRISLRTLLLALLLAAACSGPPAQGVENTVAAPTEVALAAPTEAATSVSTEDVAVAATAPAAATEAATTEVVATEANAEAAPTETRVPRPNLEATDPSTVTLAAGKPQLVEFFAFW